MNHRKVENGYVINNSLHVEDYERYNKWGAFYPLLSFSINFSSGNTGVAMRVTVYLGFKWEVFQNLFLGFNFSVLHMQDMQSRS